MCMNTLDVDKYFVDGHSVTTNDSHTDILFSTVYQYCQETLY